MASLGPDVAPRRPAALGVRAGSLSRALHQVDDEICVVPHGVLGWPSPSRVLRLRGFGQIQGVPGHSPELVWGTADGASPKEVTPQCPSQDIGHAEGVVGWSLRTPQEGRGALCGAAEGRPAPSGFGSPAARGGVGTVILCELREERKVDLETEWAPRRRAVSGCEGSLEWTGRDWCGQ